MQIGQFYRQDDGFIGRLRTLTLDVQLRITPTGFVGHSRAPEWRVHLVEDGEGAAHDPEVGSGWAHRSDRIGDYITIQLDCPGLARPMRANLLPGKQGDGAFVLLWSPRLRRPKPD
ncbi:DUF736 domain-containing protein [Sphingobium sp. B2]|uniref:DUF736 domain-containing protein n=1 Tax=Sphingobium sp. B2 TaxID=2583228 RepID=UPI0011A46E01|nr:DUF736 domain-containing protein [Sphingobium sp. B2]